MFRSAIWELLLVKVCGPGFSPFSANHSCQIAVSRKLKGDFMYQNNQTTLVLLLKALADARSRIIDSVEQEMSDSPRWPVLRSRILKYLGDRGLEARINEILSGHAE